MPIPKSQLETWSHQGSITQSSNTYGSIKGALQNNSVPYTKKNYEIFLQGSYGNNTNIYSESDVDIVILLKNCFQHDLSGLSQQQKDAFTTSHSDATYTHVDFKSDVINVLETQFGSDVNEGKKAIAISKNGSRRKADVIAAIHYRRYYEFASMQDQSYDEGVCFYTKSGEKIVNYPKYHRENLITKHQSASKQFKPMVRIFKNIRSRLVTEGMLGNNIAPSYFIEGLLYNVPVEKFTNNHEESFVNVINWIIEADKTKFICANEQYILLYDDDPVTWNSDDCELFLTAMSDIWTQW